MDDFSLMHAFFAVTTVAVILVTALTGALIVALIRVSVTIGRIATHVEEETEDLREDIGELRDDLKDGFRLVPFFHFFSNATRRISRKAPSSTKKTRIRARK